MSGHGRFLWVVGLSLVNGLFSPALPVVMAFWPVWLPELIPPEPLILFYAASLIVACGTFILAGVPAALYERLAGRPVGDPATLRLWLAGIGLLLVPALARLA